MSFQLNFLGIGSGKCGSTWLYENMVKHPEICDCNLKELNYFSALYESHSPGWYESQFAGCVPGLLRGEFSVTYLSHPEAAARIRAHFTDVKLLAIVRNPVKRAFSNYLHSIRKGDIPANLDFSDYIEDEQHLLPGQYVTHLQRFYQIFDARQIRVIVTEDFSADPLAGYRDIYRHIGVKDIDFIPPGYNERRNEARSYRFLWLESMLVRSYRGLSRRGYTRLVKRVIKSGVGERLRNINQDSKQLPRIDAASSGRLLDYYRPFNHRLGELIEKDLSHWDNPVG